MEHAAFELHGDYYGRAVLRGQKNIVVPSSDSSP